MAKLTLDQAGTERPGEGLDREALQRYFSTVDPALGQITAIGQYGGGYSNLTYLLQTTSGNWVLRRPPLGAASIKGGHNIVREFTLLEQLQQAGFHQAPSPRWCCEDAAIIGAPFYLMAQVAGLVLRAPQAATYQAQSLDFANLSRNLIAQLALLHQLDIHQHGLAQIGQPEGYIPRQVAGWTARYAAAATDPCAPMEAVATWLAHHQPPAIAPTLLHNDFKYDNLVLAAEAPHAIQAVLDWEMCTVGDPRMDLGTTLAYWAEASDSDFEKQFNLSWLPGNLSRVALIDTYQELRELELPAMLFFYVFGLFKNAVIIQQIYARYLQGLTQDPRFAALQPGVELLARKAAQAIDHQKLSA